MVILKIFFINDYIRKVWMPTKQSFRTVTKNINGILLCSCMESLYEGFPCRHEMCIFIKENMSIQNLNIHQRWTKEYFNLDQLSSPEVSDIGEEIEQIEEQGMDRGREGDMRRDGIEEMEEEVHQALVRDQWKEM